MSISERTRLACEQFERYGEGLVDQDLLKAVEALVEVNDDIWNFRGRENVVPSIDLAITHLNELKRRLKSRELRVDL